MIVNPYTEKNIDKIIFYITNARSGSYMLFDIINKIEHVNLLFELPDIHGHIKDIDKKIDYIVSRLNRDFHNNKCRYKQKRILMNKSLQYTITGCKIPNYINFNQSDFDKLSKQVKYIILYRKNILKKYISRLLARKNNFWRLHKNEKIREYDLSEKIIINDDFNKYVKDELYNTKKSKERFPSAYIIDYESIAEDYQKVFDNGLFDYLEVPKQELSCNTIKQNTRSLEEIIENYDEVKEQFPEYFVENTVDSIA